MILRRWCARYGRANGPVMALVNRLGGSLEGKMGLIPASVRDRIEAVVAQALSAAYGLAARGAQIGPDMGPRGPLIAAMASGAAGGAGGIATSLAELPVTITVILHAIQREAAAAGFDPDDPAIRAECLQVFGAGSPLDGDDGGNTSFLSARLTLTGPTVQTIIAKVAPKLAAAMGQKLVAQAVPVLGAVTGAGLNAAYLRYFTRNGGDPLWPVAAGRGAWGRYGAVGVSGGGEGGPGTAGVAHAQPLPGGFTPPSSHWRSPIILPPWDIFAQEMKILDKF